MESGRKKSKICLIIFFLWFRSTYSGTIQFGHENNSNAECINARIIIYLPTWILFQSYNSTISTTNYTTDNSSYVLFNVKKQKIFFVQRFNYISFFF